MRKTYRMENERGERDRSREFTSTPLARHSAPDCDIYSPSLTNPILLPPTRFDLAYSLPLFLFLPLILAFSSSNPIPGRFSGILTILPTLSLLRFHLLETQPRHASPCLSLHRHCAFASIPQCSVLGLLALLWRGGWLPLDDSRHPPSTKNLYVWIYNKKKERERESSKSYLCEPFLFLSFLFNVLLKL